MIDMGDGAVNPTTNNFRLTWVNGANGNQQVFGVRGYTASVSALTTTANQLYHYAIVFQANGGTGEEQGMVSWYRDGVFVTEIRCTVHHPSRQSRIFPHRSSGLVARRSQRITARTLPITRCEHTVMR